MFLFNKKIHVKTSQLTNPNKPTLAPLMRLNEALSIQCAFRVPACHDCRAEVTWQCNQSLAWIQIISPEWAVLIKQEICSRLLLLIRTACSLLWLRAKVSVNYWGREIWDSHTLVSPPWNLMNGISDFDQFQYSCFLFWFITGCLFSSILSLCMLNNKYGEAKVNLTKSYP